MLLHYCKQSRLLPLKSQAFNILLLGNALGDWVCELTKGYKDDVGFEPIDAWQTSDLEITIERAEKNGFASIILRFSSLIVVTVTPKRRRISISVACAGVTQETLDHLLLDQVLPRVLSHDGRLVLHAGLIANGYAGIAVSGVSGRGKSTLVASFQRAGYALHGDDALVVETGGPPILARSVYPSLRVLPDTLQRLFPEAPNVRSVAHYSDKLRVELPLFEDETLPPVPLTGLLFLAQPSSDERITLRCMRPAETCMALIENSFALDPTDKARARDKLVKASDLAAAVPAFELSYPRDYARLDDVRRILVEAGILSSPDVESLSTRGRLDQSR